MMRNVLVSLITLVFVVGCGGTNETAAPSDEPLRRGAAVAKPLMGVAVVGKNYTDSVLIVSNDSRNPVTSLVANNPTPGGAAPSIDISGTVTWTPNDADLQTTKSLAITATLKNGETISANLGVTVRREEVVLDVALSPDEESYSDPEGRWIVRAIRTSAERPIQGRLQITERFDKSQLVSWSVRGVGTNDTVRFEILAAPVVSTEESPASLTLQADYPLSEISLGGTEFENVGLSKVGSVITRGTNVFTSRSATSYTIKEDADPHTFASESHQVFNFLSSCPEAMSVCKERAQYKAPVILIHGFSGEDNAASDAIAGGGDGTWGQFPQHLIDQGHPVFEMRWHTYMRFEEAAGALTKFSQAISTMTARKPIIVAHSFGGVVSHLALQSQGIIHSGGTWINTKYNKQVAKLITLNSPLSGINHPSGSFDRSDFVVNKQMSSGGEFRMTRGRDHTDKLIGSCYAVTCLQAGALFPKNNNNGLQLKANTALISGDPQVSVRYKTGSQDEMVAAASTNNIIWEGESIKRLQENLSSMETPILRFAGFQKTGVEDANELLGDGLISLIGMAVQPENFVEHFDNINSDFGYKFINNQKYSLYRQGASIVKSFHELDAGDCFYWNSNPHEYVVCAMSAHTGSGISGTTTGKRLPLSSDFSIAYLGNEDPGITHPLKTLAADNNWLASAPQNAPDITDLLAQAPEAVFVWRAYRTTGGAADYVYRLPAALTVTEKSTGRVVLQSTIMGNADTKMYRFNLGRELTRELGKVPDLSQYSMKIQMGGGLFDLFNYAAYHQEFSNLYGVQIIDPHIDLTKSDVVSIQGQVIDGQTISTPIADAVVYMAKGTDRSASYLKNISTTGTKTTRKVQTDATGSFNAEGLEPGNYSVLVTKAGYTDELQGRVTVTSGSKLSLNLLRVLPSGEASITLRWANSSAGSNVVPDLDSHLIRFNGNALDYHIYYGRSGVVGLADSLDRDDTDYEGPETITFGLDTAKSYTYYVHQFSVEGTIVQSFPRVYVRIGATTESFAPPSIQGSAHYWRVFDIVGGIVKPCRVDCLMEAAPTGLSGQTSAFPQLPPTIDRLFKQLPMKR